MTTFYDNRTGRSIARASADHGTEGREVIWQPIETAPKNGTTILAWGRFLTEPVTVQWRLGHWTGTHDGWLSIYHQSDFGTDYHTEDTVSHWMLLPAPPECEP